VQLLEHLLQQQPLLAELHLPRLPLLQPLQQRLQQRPLVAHQPRLPQRLVQLRPILTVLHLQLQHPPALQLQQLRLLESRLLPSVRLQQLQHLQVTRHLLHRL
jgi:hypothetical protein